MSVGHRVKNIRLRSGERLPLLQNTDTGLPEWAPTVFVITQLRAAGLATQTLLQATRAIMVGEQVLRHLGINLESRLAEGRLLELGELDALTDLLGLEQRGIDEITAASSPPSQSSRRLVSFERVRMRTVPKGAESVVAPSTKAVRLVYLRDYIHWMVSRRLIMLDHRAPSHRALSEADKQFVDLINARIPSPQGPDSVQAREGLDENLQKRIQEVVNPKSSENPWKNHHTRIRNQLIFMWLLGLGLRKGELLGVKLSDIDLRSGTVMIRRRADDPEETRRDPPNAKTKARLLSINGDLAEITRSYVLGPRRTMKNAQRHPFLFVATGTGKPLTTSGLGKLFVELRRKVPGLPEDLCPHILRHTWNERFSELMDERGIAPEEEEKLRKQQMGWSDRSKMPATYTRRHVRRKANEASLALQAKSFKRNGDKR